MTRRLGLNLIILLLVILLAGVAYFEPGRERNSAPAALPLLNLPVDQVNQIQLQQGDDRIIQIERAGDGWQIIKPLRVAASDYRVHGLMQLITATSHAHFPAAQRPLSDFGLDKPAARVSFNDQMILFGSNEALDGRRYVLADDQIHLIDDRYYYQSQLLLTALVDTAVVPPQRELTRLKLPGLQVQQQQGNWQLQQPESVLRAQPAPSVDHVNELLDEWQRARATRISLFQTDVATDNIELGFADGGVISLEILGREPELILGRRDLGLRYHFTSDYSERLLSLPQSVPTTGMAGPGDDD